MRCVKIIYSMVPGGTMTNTRLFESHAAATLWLAKHGYTIRAKNEGTLEPDVDGQIIWVGDNQYSAPVNVA